VLYNLVLWTMWCPREMAFLERNRKLHHSIGGSYKDYEKPQLVSFLNSGRSCLATRHGGVWERRRYGFYSFLTSALDGGEWSASRPGRTLPPGKGPPVPIGTHWIGGWVGRRAGPDAGARRKILCPCLGSNPDRPARIQTLYCLSYRGSWAERGHYKKT
jgi:hypothetical protein